MGGWSDICWCNSFILTAGMNYIKKIILIALTFIRNQNDLIIFFFRSTDQTFRSLWTSFGFNLCLGDSNYHSSSYESAAGIT
jgi:hypothetical protein